MMLEEFYVTTNTSVYHVEYDKKHNQAKATKIALKGESKVKLGQVLDGPMVAIARWLQFYVPEGGGLTSYERKLEMINTKWWFGNTSNIVALFFEEEKARSCLFDNNDLFSCDPRWLDSTRKVVDAIDHKHPVFEVCEFEDLRLLP